MVNAKTPVGCSLQPSYTNPLEMDDKDTDPPSQPPFLPCRNLTMNQAVYVSLSILSLVGLVGAGVAVGSG
jgi:hypothetical protein